MESTSDAEVNAEIAQLAELAGLGIELQQVRHRSFDGQTILGQILMFVVTEIGKEVIKAFTGDLRERFGSLVRRLTRRPGSTLLVVIRTDAGKVRLEANIASDEDFDRLAGAIQGLLKPPGPPPREPLLLGPDGQWRPLLRPPDAQ